MDTHIKNQLTPHQLKICELTTPELFEKFVGVKVTSTAMEAVVALMCRVQELEAKIEKMDNEQIKEALFQ